jgi:hypothetical protein
MTRAELVEARIERRARPAEVRKALIDAITHPRSYANLVRMAGDRATLVEWCRYARFPLPKELQPEVEVYRGVAGCSAEVAAAGLHWSLRLEVAAWFADHYAMYHQSPLIIQARVPRTALVYYSDDAEEAEVILAKAPEQFTVISDPVLVGEAALRCTKAGAGSWVLKSQQERL